MAGFSNLIPGINQLAGFRVLLAGSGRCDLAPGTRRSLLLWRSEWNCDE